MRATELLHRGAPLLGLILLAGCAGILDPMGWRREIGDIGGGGSLPAPITLPASARVGTPIIATVVTYGSSSCTRSDGASVSVTGLQAVITPYDLRATGGSAVCTMDLASFPRQVELRFHQPGTAQIRVIGRTGTQPAAYDTVIQVQP